MDDWRARTNLSITYVETWGQRSVLGLQLGLQRTEFSSFFQCVDKAHMDRARALLDVPVGDITEFLLWG
jgi:hypothetical protein